MKLYLKYGQVVDLGNVVTIWKDDRKPMKPWKDCKDGDELFAVSEWELTESEDVLVQFYNDENKRFECRLSSVVGVLEDTK